jgi:hypothetical protein
MLDPDLAMVLETITAIKDGTLAGGEELLPGRHWHSQAI